ncbi:MAG: Grx4 family monothiol glutaredoxin [Myxococcota bacterium]|nr:Grx4 family monothiol glutaredoxin [Myxococcota bacterium]
MSLPDDTRQRIQSVIDSDRVVLFMKGSRQMPQCGFSAQVVQILDSQLGEYTTVDVLQDPEIRQGIKEFSSWPTIPQLYVGGEFIGGCDILTEMYQAGELSQTLGTA